MWPRKLVFILLLWGFAGNMAQRATSLAFPNGGPRSCTLHRTSIRGTCQSIYECPIVLRNVRKLRPTVCHFEGRVPFVCCPARKLTATDVSPPSVSFTCGTSSVKPATLSNVERFVVRSLRIPEDGDPSPEISLRSSLGNLHKEVFRGVTSIKNSWPWMAVLGYRTKPEPTWVCDGVLINQQWVLTAAHCLLRKFVDIVRLGEHDLGSSNESPRQDFEVSDSVFHPGYNYPQGYHDLALLRLDRPANFNTAVRPICLPWGKQLVPDVGSLLSLTGWGRTTFGGNRSNVLQEATVYILDRQKCVSSFSSLLDYAEKYPRGVTSDLLCVGDTDGEGQDACQGDSGGPVTYLNNGKHVLTGIVSRGYGCGNPDFPGLYASVHHAPDLAWIKRVAF